MKSAVVLLAVISIISAAPQGLPEDFFNFFLSTGNILPVENFARSSIPQSRGGNSVFIFSSSTGSQGGASGAASVFSRAAQ